MNNKTVQIKNVLVKAERDLQEIIAESAKDGDYRSVDVARIAAANLRELSAHISEPALNKKANNSVHKTEAKAITKKRKKASAKNPILWYSSTETAASLLLNLFPAGPKIRGKWANFGISAPKAS